MIKVKKIDIPFEFEVFTATITDGELMPKNNPGYDVLANGKKIECKTFCTKNRPSLGSKPLDFNKSFRWNLMNACVADLYYLYIDKTPENNNFKVESILKLSKLRFYEWALDKAELDTDGNGNAKFRLKKSTRTKAQDEKLKQFRK